MNLRLKLSSVFLTILCISVLFLSSFSVQVQATKISPFAYYDPNSVSFKGSYSAFLNYYDGNYMAFEAKATSSDGKSHEVIITLYISNTNTTKQYRIYTDGLTRKADHIPIGNGGSDVVIKANCSDASVTINLDLKMYSWQQ